PLFLRAREHGNKTAVIDQNGKFSYNSLLQLSKDIGDKIRQRCLSEGTDDLKGRRIAFLTGHNVQYVATQWAIWRNGGVAVPLCTSHPLDMLKYYIEDSNSSLLITSDEFNSKVDPLLHQKASVPHLNISNENIQNITYKPISGLYQTSVEKAETSWNERSAMIIYTSGTTGRPKGVLTTHGNISAQITALINAWGWTDDDVILHVLPLHHVHGIINVLACPLWVGATCVMRPRFEADEVWEYFTGSNPQLSVFMAVPTIYNKLISNYKKAKHSEQRKKEIIEKCSSLSLSLRLMVSGSSALPEVDMTVWEEITGHVLLERYGMTEIGMALSNPLNGTRLPNCVGIPLPGVQVRIVSTDENGNQKVKMTIAEGDEQGSRVLDGSKSAEGILHVRGPSVFKGYWNRPEATKESFTEDGWFITGDTARLSDGVYRIIGRPWDIIKSGGYKISALEVERELRQHPDVKDCAVLGIPDPEWGERVAAIVALNDNSALTLEDLRAWGSDHMVRYHIPAALHIVEELPRNVMGKVNKKELYSAYFK
ncbi:predicted protein, partial [Nematostella vectensis]